MRSLLPSVLVLVCLAAAVSARAVTLDIDSLPPGMSNSPGSFVPTTARVSNQFRSQGVLVSSGAGYAAVVLDQGGTVWKQGDPAVKQGLGGTGSGDTLSYATPLVFTFVSPTNAAVPYVTNAFSIYADYNGDGSLVTVSGYDLAGALVAQASRNEHSGSAAFGDLYSISGAGISRVVVQGTGTTAFSNVQFNAVTPVPEPATIAALGLGAAALLRRRRKA